MPSGTYSTVLARMSAAFDPRRLKGDPADSMPCGFAGKLGERHRDQQQRRPPDAERRRISRRIVRAYSIRSSHVGSLDAQLKVQQSASLTFDIESGCAVKRRAVHAQYSIEAFRRWPPWRTSNDFDDAARGGAPHARGGFKSA